MCYGRLSRALAACLAVLGLAACAQSTRVAMLPDGVRFIDHVATTGAPSDIAPGAGGPPPRGFSGEIAEVNTSLANAPVPVPDRLLRELTSLRDCLLAGWPGRPAAPELVVSSSLMPGGEAVPGRVTLYLGLLAGDEADEAHVAFVLAHELAHVLLHHFDRVEFLEGQKRVTTGLAAAGVLASVLAETEVDDGRGQPRLHVADQEAVGDNTQLVVAGFAVAQLLLDGILESSWSRDQELEADLLGVDLLVNGGLPRFAAANALQAHQRYEAQRKTRLELFEGIAEHRMEEAAATGDLDTVIETGLAVLSGAASRGLADLYDFVDRPALGVDGRMQALRDYETRVFAGRDVTALNVGPTCSLEGLRSALADPRLDRQHDAIFAAQGVEQAILEGNFAQARRDAQRGLQGELRGHPVPRLAAFKLASAEGDRREALGHLLAIRRDADTPIAVYTFLAAELLKHGRATEARRVLSEGRRIYFEDPFYPLRLRTAYALEDEAEVAAVRNACAGSEYRRVRGACADIVRAHTPDVEHGGPGFLGDVLESVEESLNQTM